MKKRGPTKIGLDLLDVPPVDKDGMDQQFMAMPDYPHSRIQFDFQNERMPTFDFMNNTLGPHNQQNSEIESRKQKITASSSGHFPSLQELEAEEKKHKHKKHKDKGKDKGKEKSRDKEKGKDKEKKEKGKDKVKDKEKESDKEKSKDKEKDKVKDKEKEGDKEKEKETEKEKEKDVSKEKDSDKEKSKDKEKDSDKEKDKAKSKRKEKERSKDQDSEREADKETDRESSHRKKRKKRDSDGKKHKKRKKDKDEKKEDETEKESDKDEDLTEVASVPLSPLAQTPPIDEVASLDLSSMGKPRYEKVKKGSVHSRIIPPSEVKAANSSPTSPLRKPETQPESPSLTTSISESSSALKFDESEVTEDEDENKSVEELKEMKERRRHKHRHRRRKKRKEQEILLVPSPSNEPSVNSSPARQMAPIGAEPADDKEKALHRVDSHSLRETVPIPRPQTTEKPDEDNEDEMLKMPTSVQRQVPPVQDSSPPCPPECPSSDMGKPPEPLKTPKPPIPKSATLKQVIPAATRPISMPVNTQAGRRPARKKLVVQDMRRTISLEVEQANQAMKRTSAGMALDAPHVHERTASLASSSQLLSRGVPLVRSISHERSLEEQLKEVIENPKAGRLAGSKIKRELPPSVIGIHELRHAIGQSIRGQALPNREGIQGTLTADSIDQFFSGAGAAIAHSFKPSAADDRSLQILKRNLTDKINVTEREFGGVNENVRSLSDDMGKVSACLTSSQAKVGASEKKAEKLEKSMLKMKKLVIAEADQSLHFDSFLRKILLRVFAYLIWFVLFVSRVVLAPFMKPENLPPDVSVSEAARKIQRAADRIEMNRLLEEPDTGPVDTKPEYC